MKTEEVDQLPNPQNELDLAIIGISCRFPGAANLEQFWKNLANGVESISRLSDEEMLRASVPQSFLENPSYVKAAPILEGPELFDAAFFGFSPAEARTMDPQHRILLELAHEALENAGCNPNRYAGRIGVFSGAAMNTYFMNSGLSSRFAEDYIPTLIVNDKDFLSTRLSYKLNLKGPSITIQTACSTSLVAVHLARQSLLSHETDIVLAGAISVRVPHQGGYFCDGGGVVSPDGRVRAFDANANGTVFGSGGGIIVLKRLADALANGDTIHAVIKGSAVNNDGSEKAGYTAPSVNSQADAVVEALANAGIDAESISYIEAHGSGTPVGDPIEITALTKAFRTFTQRSGYCAIGSVKTNIGHLDAAAGIAGIIKTVLALEHRQLPPSLHYNAPNPEINFSATPFYVNTQLVPWASLSPRRAGVMSTGMGGTNAHVVLEEAPPLGAAANSDLPHLLVLSAKNAAALDTAAENLREFLKSNAAARMEDVAYTLQTGREAFPHRRILVCADREEAIATLADEKSKRVVSSQIDESTRRPLVFLLPGVGDHYVGMGRDLYEKWQAFRQEVDRCAALLEPHLKIDIREIIYPPDLVKAKEGKKGIDLRKMLGRDGQEDPAAQKLNQTLYAQPALFTIEYALARLWQNLGIVPDAIIGHSMGEYVAACLAGVFSLEDALRLIAQRAKRVSDLPQGAMLAVMLSEAEILPLLNEQLSISLINGPNLCVVAGPVPALAEFEKMLTAKGIISRPVQNAHAFHSRMLDPIVTAFAEDVKTVPLHEPKIPFVSNVTGKWITKAEATDPSYWARHANHTARFSDALHQLWQFKNAILLEAGPGKTLGVLASQHPDRRDAGDAVTVSSLRHNYENQSDLEFLLHSIGKLWLSGVDVTWENLPQAKQRRKIPLPTYPFERQSHWLDSIFLSAPAKQTAIHKNAELSKWFYLPSWKRTLPKPIGVAELAQRKKQNWIVFSDDGALTSQIVDRLKTSGQRVVAVKAGEAFHQVDSYNFILGPGSTHDYERLIGALQADDWVPDRVIHAWSLENSDPSRTDSFKRTQDSGFYSLLFLARALAKQNFNNDLKLFVLSNQIQDVHGDEPLSPEKSTLLGPCMVIPQEYPNIRIKSVDLESPARTRIDSSSVDQLVGEFFNSDSELFVAYRNGHRWVQAYEQVQLNQDAAPVFREHGVYLITGGLGNIGREISKHLAKNYKARLVLVGRSPLPKTKLWDAWVAGHPADDPVTEKIRKVAEIEKLGGEVLYLDASVDDAESMRQVLNQAQGRFGELNGVIHGAGVIGGQGYRETKEVDPAHCDLHFQAKAHGLCVLENLLDGMPLDFCLLLSSLTSILGGIGQAAYAASNVYMDTFTRRHNRSDRAPWISVNWDVWRLQGDEWGIAGAGKTLAELGMTGEEAVKAMEIVLPNKNASQLIVSTGDLEARIKQWIKFESLDKKPFQQAGTDQSTRSERPSLPTRYDAPKDETEQIIAEIWQAVLGIEQVGVTDNFSDLGGHSLLAIKIVSELRNAFRIDLPVRALFDAPTVAELSAYIKNQNNGSQPAPPIEPICGKPATPAKPSGLLEIIRNENPELQVEDAFVVPHWFVQQKTWLENPAGSDNAVYNYPLLLRIGGRLDESALEQSLDAVVRRHPVYRSVFRIQDRQLVQIIVPPQKQILPLTDLSHLPKTERETQAQQIAQLEADRPFDLRRAPLLRAALIRLAADDHLLQLTTHLIVHDDWSTGILARDLSELYRAFGAGDTPHPHERSFQYGDYVRWHQEQLRGKKLESKLSYWKRQLTSANGFQHLPTDFARPAKSTNRGARERAVLSTELADLLNALSRRERVSMFMVLLAGFQSLLHRYSKHEEIGVATCAANRPIAEVETLIGRFGNDTLLRTSLSGNPTFRELLTRVRETALTAYSDQDLPFGILLSEFANGENRQPPFQVMFILQNAPHEDPQVPGLTMNWSPLYTGTAKYDLNVWLKIEPELEIVLEYNADLFRTATMKQILDDYEGILETMAKDPGARIESLHASRKAAASRTKPAPPVASVPLGFENNGAQLDEVQSELVELWEAAFAIQPIGVDQNFFELGGDSLLAARLFPQMEKAFRMDLPLAILLGAPTIRQLAEIISRRNGRSFASSLVPIQSEGTKPPLFCVHSHMGEIFYCRNLARALGADQPLYGLRSQGLGSEAPHHTVEEMAVHYLKEIRTAQPHGPYFLSGFCLGGMVAYEMARLLKTQGQDVALVVLFNTPAPGGLKGWPLNPVYLVKRIAHELKKMRNFGMREKLAVFTRKTATFATLVSGVFKTTLWRTLSRSSNGRAGKLAPRLLSVADLNVSAAKAYYPAAYPGRVTLFLTEEVASLYRIDPKEGWRNLAEDGIEVHDVDGDTNAMFHAQFVNALAEKLKSCVARAGEPSRNLPPSSSRPLQMRSPIGLNWCPPKATELMSVASTATPQHNPAPVTNVELPTAVRRRDHPKLLRSSRVHPARG